MPMMDFADFLAESAKANKKDTNFKPTTTIPLHATGYVYLDYAAGNYVTVYNDDEIPLYQYHNVGVPAGSVIGLISKTQGGKTTTAIQMAASIIEPYFSPLYWNRYIKENEQRLSKDDLKKIMTDASNGMPFIQIADVEGTLPLDYVKKLGHYTNKQLKNRVIIDHITTDNDLIALLEKHARYKATHMNQTIYPMLDLYGNPIVDYPPTVLIVDSVTQLTLEGLEEETMDNKGKGLSDIYESASKGMAGAQRARVIGALYTQMVDVAKKFNIIIFCINHINTMPAVMGIPVKGARFLRGGETISGGVKPLYLLASLLRLDVIKSIGGTSSSAVQIGDGIKGHIALAEWSKCKTNSKRNNCHMCYTEQNGYDPLLSTLWHAKEVGDLQKKGNFYYVDKHPDLPFNFKNYADVFASNPELFMALYDQTREHAAKMLDNPDHALEQYKKEVSAVRDDIHDEYEDGIMSRGAAMDMDDMFATLVND